MLWDESANYLNLADNTYLSLGTGNDALFAHTGAHLNLQNYVGEFQFINNTADGNINFKADDGTGSAVTEYFRCDGGVVYTIFTKEIRMLDGVQLQLGSDNDMQLQHNGANGYVQVATGDLVIKNTADDVKILAEDDIVLRDIDDSTNFLHCINGGAVELFHNGTKKFETTSAGATVTGGITTTGASIIGGQLTTGTALQLFVSGGNNFISSETAGHLIIRNTHSSGYDIVLQASDGSGSYENWVSLDSSAQKIVVTKSIEVTGGVVSQIPINAETASYTLVLGDQGGLVEVTSSSATNVTIPPNSSVAYAVGTQIIVQRNGTGAVTIVEGSGVTAQSANSQLNIRAQYGA